MSARGDGRVSTAGVGGRWCGGRCRAGVVRRVGGGWRGAACVSVRAGASVVGGCVDVGGGYDVGRASVRVRRGGRTKGVRWRRGRAGARWCAVDKRRSGGGRASAAGVDVGVVGVACQGNVVGASGNARAHVGGGRATTMSGGRSGQVTMGGRCGRARVRRSGGRVRVGRAGGASGAGRGQAGDVQVR